MLYNKILSKCSSTEDFFYNSYTYIYMRKNWNHEWQIFLSVEKYSGTPLKKHLESFCLWHMVHMITNMEIWRNEFQKVREG